MNIRWFSVGMLPVLLSSTSAFALAPSKFCGSMMAQDYGRKMVAVAKKARATNQWTEYERTIRDMSSGLFAIIAPLVATPGSATATSRLTLSPGSTRRALFLTFDGSPGTSSKAFRKPEVERIDSKAIVRGDYLLEITRYGEAGSLGADFVICSHNDDGTAGDPTLHPVITLNLGTKPSPVKDPAVDPFATVTVDDDAKVQSYSALLRDTTLQNLVLYVMPQSAYRGGSFEVRVTRKRCSQGSKTAPLTCVDNP